MPVAVASRRRRVGARSAQVRRDAARLLAILGIDAELSIALVGDDEIQGLNARYRKKDRPTDVLSFATDGDEVIAGGVLASSPRRRGSIRNPRPAQQMDSRLRGNDGVVTKHTPPLLLGDVVISLDTAARQATARGVALADEVRFLLAHGILHLLGYDHERSPAEARRMFAKQRRLLRRLAGLRTQD